MPDPDQSPEELDVRLSRSEALVLFELLSRWDEGDGLFPSEYRKPKTFAYPSEAIALNALLNLLEQHLVEPFSSTYSTRLEQARNELHDIFGPYEDVRADAPE